MESPKDTSESQHNQHGTKRILFAWGVWFLFSLIVVVFSFPIIKESIHKSGVLALLQDMETVHSNREMRTVDVCFSTYSSGYQLFPQQQMRLGGSVYHDTFESLLAGPDQQALSKGAVSYIHPETRLIGITLSNGILYVDVTKEFLQSPYQDKAKEQLRKTATSFSRIKDMILLIENEEQTISE